jgi:hypothetical protein
VAVLGTCPGSKYWTSGADRAHPVPVFVIMFMRIEERYPWRIVLPMTVFMCVFIDVPFDQLLAIPLPRSVLGEFIPSLKGGAPSV